MQEITVGFWTYRITRIPSASRVHSGYSISRVYGQGTVDEKPDFEWSDYGRTLNDAISIVEAQSC